MIVRYVIPPPPTITVSDTSHGFGDVIVNATGTWSYTVSGIALTNNLTVTAPSADFPIATNGGAYGSQVIVPTNTDGTVSTTTIYVHFIPTAIQLYSGTITNASAGAADQLVTLTGIGINPQPVLYVTPNSLSLGNVITNKTSTNFVYTLSGILLQGDATVTVPSAYFAVSTNASGPFGASATVSVPAPFPATLSATPIYVQFTPSAGAGQYLGSITNSSLNAADKIVALTGTGVVQGIYLGAETVAFGNVLTNTTSANQSFTLSGSNLEANVTVTVPSAVFTVSTNASTGFGQSCTVSVANVSSPSGGSLPSTTVYVRFTPSSVQLYSENITCSSAGAVSQNKPVTGTGVVPPGPNAYVVPLGTPGASPAYPYNTWALAFTNIQDAVTFAGANQPGVTTVVVSNGTYNTTAEIALNAAITICSFGNGVYGGLANASNTVVQASGDGYRIFSIANASSVVEGFTIRNGYVSPGGNVNMSDGKLISCIVKENRQSLSNEKGGGIYMSGGTVSNCIVRNCSTNWRNGGGIYADGGLIVGCQILNNSAANYEENQQGGGGVYANNVTIRNCLIAGNTAYPVGGGVWLLGSSKIENCTIVANSALSSGSTAQGGGVYRAGGTVSNSIVYFNTMAKQGGGAVGTESNIWNAVSSVYYTCTTNPVVSGSSNISDDPLFVNAAGGDYSLKYAPVKSPCIDKGANQAWMDGAKDLAGNTRKTYGGVAGSHSSPVVDMGAYEAPEAPPKGTVFMLR